MEAWFFLKGDAARIQAHDFQQQVDQPFHPFQGLEGFPGEFGDGFRAIRLILHDFRIQVQGGKGRFELMGNIGDRILQKLFRMPKGFVSGLEGGGETVDGIEQNV